MRIFVFCWNFFAEETHDPVHFCQIISRPAKSPLAYRVTYFDRSLNFHGWPNPVFDNYLLPTEVRKLSVFNNYMIYKSTSQREKQMREKRIKKPAEEKTAIFWPTRSN